MHGNRPGRVAEDAHELAFALRKFRGRVGLRTYEETQERWVKAASQAGPTLPVISRSQLSRYEHANIPPLKHADHLDRLYGGGGWVAMSIRSLWRSRWDPWSGDSEEWAGKNHFGRWPASYSGMVWIKIKPKPTEVDTTVEVDLEWGPWGRTISIALPKEGVTLVTGKAKDTDGISRTCNVRADRAVFALFGAGEDLGNENVLDIRQGWDPRHPERAVLEPHDCPTEPSSSG